jgi:hypothetical protein
VVAVLNTGGGTVLNLNGNGLGVVFVGRFLSVIKPNTTPPIKTITEMIIATINDVCIYYMIDKKFNIKNI